LAACLLACTSWQDTAKDQLIRLDGSAMFQYRDRIYAIGWAHPYFNKVFPKRGSALTEKSN